MQKIIIKITCVLILAACTGQHAAAQDLTWKWVRTVAADNNMHALVLPDGNGNVYVAASFRGKFDEDDITILPTTDNGNMVLAKYDAKGVVIWAKEITATRRLRLGKAGEIYYSSCDSGKKVARYRYENDRPFIACLDSNGNQLWRSAPDEKLKGSPVDFWVQKDGSVQLILSQITQIKEYDPADKDAPLFERSYLKGFCRPGKKLETGDTLIKFTEELADLEMMINGSGIYVTGRAMKDISYGSFKFKYRKRRAHFLAKFSMDSLLWVRSFTAYNNDPDMLYSGAEINMETDSRDNIILAGTFGHVAFDDLEWDRKGSSDGFIAKLSSKGDFIWLKQIGDVNLSGNCAARIKAVAVDAYDHIFITGSFNDQLTIGNQVYYTRGEKKTYPDRSKPYYTQSDCFVACINGEGNIIMSADGGGRGADYGIALAVAPQGTVYMLGSGFNETAIFGEKSISFGDRYSYITKLEPAPDIQNRKTSGQPARVWAVVIGITEYKDKNLATLKYAAADAQLYSDFLKSAQGGKIPGDRISILLNKNATRANIIKSLTSVFYRAYEDDVIMLYLASHGQPDQRGNELYFMPYDADADNPEGTALSQGDIQKIVARSKANRKIIIADACHSGGLGTDIGTKRSGDQAGLVAALLEKMAIAQEGTAVLSASGKSEVSFESSAMGSGHGFFSYFLVEALKGKGDLNDDNIITIREAYEYVYKKVAEATKGVQHPELKGDFDNNFPLSIIEKK